jgi:hypothetical protein
VSAPLIGGVNGVFNAFQRVYNVPTRSPTPSTLQATATPSSTGSLESSRDTVHKIPIIVGSVLGGVIFLLITIGATIFLRRHRHKTENPPKRGRDDDKMVNEEGLTKKVVLSTSAELSGEQQLPTELQDNRKIQERAELWTPPSELPAEDGLRSAKGEGEVQVEPKFIK